MGPDASRNLLADLVEPRRKSQALSLRRAADRAGMSEATWRQLVRGGVTTQGQWVARVPQRIQLLTMAAAVGEDALTHMVEAVSATEEETAAARARVHIPDPAEEEILGSRHLLPEEKLRLVEALRAYRSGSVDDDEEPQAG